MDPTIADVEARAEEHVETYRETAPFHPVEAESIETLPEAFRTGDYGRRDVEWVVRWYFRRRVDAIDHDERRAVEEAVEDADSRELRGAMWDAVDALDEGADSDGEGDRDGDSPMPAHHRALDALTDLPGVDVAVASALLWFLDPDRFLVVGDREWRVVATLTDLDSGYPDPMTLGAYDRYLDAVRTLSDRLDVDGWHLYMVIQRVYAEEFAGE
ncbi:hypothetical protein [Halorubrum depositum]|uniref:hypothetical protein n=1 Tax=Halorubrum depositum TaxID=2583992 RepID=UPI0011A3256B|nr:hypothetical protein [Halorubrum depositum]